MKSPLNQILTGYLRENNYTNYLSLEEIPLFKEFFCDYLQKLQNISEDNIDESFRRWCNQLSRNRAFPEVRKFAVYILWLNCELRQYHIAQLLGVSTRTIRRDQARMGNAGRNLRGPRGSPQDVSGAYNEVYTSAKPAGPRTSRKWM